MDIEKVIKGLNCCIYSDGRGCPSCPYSKEENCNCVDILHMDALAVLKEQEAVKPNIYTKTITIIENRYKLDTHFAECGNCGRSLIMPSSSRMYTYCPECGKKVKWE